ncbi:MAG: type II toxin-antitoxin system RelE family toxin [Sporichthyaceae bacterium]
MVEDTSPYRLLVTRPAARSLAEDLPESVATAVLAFLTGDLLLAPHRVGKALHRELAGRHAARRGDYRVIYRTDDAARTVTVLAVEHRRDAYRRR